MPQNRNNTEPPPVMTWGKAIPVLIVAAIFDALRLLFDFLWFFGPAMAIAFCSLKYGVSLAGAVCNGVAAGAGFGLFGFIAPFGTIMAMATGFAGWLVVGGWLMATNARIFKENALWFVGSLLVSEIPFVNSIPAITIAVWRMYRNQIKIEKAAFAKWEKENASAQLQQRNQVAAQVMQIQAAQQAQFMEQEAANEAVYAEAANDEQYEIPEDEKMAA